MYDESLIIFASDHGDEFYEHNAFGHGHDNLYPELTWVPLVIRFPTSLQISPQRIAATVSNLDLIPTILDVIGIEQPANMLGSSLLPLEQLTASPRVASSHFGSSLMLRCGRYAALVDPEQAGQVRYFDLDTDPGQLRQVDAAAVGELAALFDEHAKAWYASYLEEVGDKADDGSKIDEHHHMDDDLRRQLKSLGYVK